MLLLVAAGEVLGLRIVVVAQDVEPLDQVVGQGVVDAALEGEGGGFAGVGAGIAFVAPENRVGNFDVIRDPIEIRK